MGTFVTGRLTDGAHNIRTRLPCHFLEKSATTTDYRSDSREPVLRKSIVIFIHGEKWLYPGYDFSHYLRQLITGHMCLSPKIVNIVNHFVTRGQRKSLSHLHSPPPLLHEPICLLNFTIRGACKKQQKSSKQNEQKTEPYHAASHPHSDSKNISKITLYNRMHTIDEYQVTLS